MQVAHSNYINREKKEEAEQLSEVRKKEELKKRKNSE